MHRPVLELNGEWHAKDAQSGVNDPNSGGTTLYLAPVLRFSKHGRASFLPVGVAILHDLNGNQSEPDVRTLSGLTAWF